jgi:hypothetical protein
MVRAKSGNNLEADKTLAFIFQREVDTKQKLGSGFDSNQGSDVFGGEKAAQFPLSAKRKLEARLPRQA